MNFEEKPYQLLLGDCRERLKDIPTNTVDAVVTDPPYELGFMGKSWDASGIAYSVEMWKEVLRVMKPGAHILAFSGTRTYHRMVVAMEDAGFEIRDQLQWNYGSGFPKSFDIRKAIAKMGILCECEKAYQLRGVRKNNLEMDVLVEAASLGSVQLPVQRGAEGGGVGRTRSQGPQGVDESELGKLSREDDRPEKSCVEGRGDLQASKGELHRSEVREMPEGMDLDGSEGRLRNGAPLDHGDPHGPTTHEGRGGASPGPQHTKQQDRKPGILSDESGAQTCGRCGKSKTARFDGLGTSLKPANEPIVLARKPLEKDSVAKNVLKYGTGGINVDAGRIETNEDLNGGAYSGGKRPTQFFNGGLYRKEPESFSQPSGRFPSNVLLDEEAARMLDEQSGKRRSAGDYPAQNPGACKPGYDGGWDRQGPLYADSGGASRFFYTAKTSKWERNFGLDGMPKKRGGAEQYDSRWKEGTGENRMPMNQNSHPTVKPFTLMRYLVNLITPPGGVVLDPFLGSGTTGAVSVACGFKFIGIEMTPEYMEIAKGRIGSVKLNEVID